MFMICFLAGPLGRETKGENCSLEPLQPRFFSSLEDSKIFMERTDDFQSCHYPFRPMVLNSGRNSKTHPSLAVIFSAQLSLHIML